MRRVVTWLLARPSPSVRDAAIERAFEAGWDAGFFNRSGSERPVTIAGRAAWQDGFGRGRIAAEVW